MGNSSAAAVGYFGNTQNDRSAFGATTYSNGPQGVQAMIGGGSTTYYDRTPDGQLVGEHGPDGDFYYAFDNQGSVIAIITTNGTGTSSYRYDPFGSNVVIGGNTAVANDNPYRYTGAYYDRLTGIYHLGARYYDPTTGRFTQQDSIDHLADPTQGNKYAYAGDDPINNLDPSGNDFFSSALSYASDVVGLASPIIPGAAVVSAGLGVASVVYNCSTGEGSCAGSVGGLALQAVGFGAGAIIGKAASPELAKSYGAASYVGGAIGSAADFGLNIANGT